MEDEDPTTSIGSSNTYGSKPHSHRGVALIQMPQEKTPEPIKDSLCPQKNDPGFASTPRQLMTLLVSHWAPGPVRRPWWKFRSALAFRCVEVRSRVQRALEYPLGSAYCLAQRPDRFALVFCRRNATCCLDLMWRRVWLGRCCWSL